MRVVFYSLAIPLVLASRIPRSLKCRDQAGSPGSTVGGNLPTGIPSGVSTPISSSVVAPVQSSTANNTIVSAVYSDCNSAKSNDWDGTKQRTGEVKEATGSNICSGPYGVNTKGDIPFSRATRGNLIFYPQGEGNSPNKATDTWM